MNATNRVTCKQIRPNPLFEEWVASMYAEAKSKNSSLEQMLHEASESLSKYPLPLKSGAECMILKGFDERLCKYLDSLLNQYKQNLALSQCCDSRCDQVIDLCSDNGKSSPAQHITRSRSNSSVSATPLNDSNGRMELLLNVSTDYEMHDDEVDRSTLQKQKLVHTNGKKKYVPEYRSGAFAILVALLEQSLEKPCKPSMTQEQLIEKAQKHAEHSFVRPKPGTFYTAWSGMTKLLTKRLVKKTKNNNNKPEYQLTKNGKELAKTILSETKSIPSSNDIIFNNAPSTSGVFNKNANSAPVPSTSGNINGNIVIEMAPGTFDIILLIDKNETGGLRKKNDPTVAQFNNYPDLNHEYRSLKVGDFTWIAKSKVNKDQELVLPYVVERKRMDDLGASIKDGRFHEQKFRLRKCGLNNVIYMVENYGKNKNVGLPIQSLMQALANTRVQDGFNVHVTDSLANSARFLAMMTKRLTIRYQDKHLQGYDDDPEDDNLMTFEYFNKSSAKNKPVTVTEMFIKILLQLKGVSVEKALAITKKYPTPRSLITAYAKCDRKEGECLLAYLKCGEQNRNLGPATSKTIYQLFSSSGSE